MLGAFAPVTASDKLALCKIGYWIVEDGAGGAERFAKSALTIRASAIQYSPTGARAYFLRA